MFTLLCETPVFIFLIQAIGVILILIALITFSRVGYLYLLFHGDEETHVAVRKYSIYGAIEFLGALILFVIVSSCT